MVKFNGFIARSWLGKGKGKSEAYSTRGPDEAVKGRDAGRNLVSFLKATGQLVLGTNFGSDSDVHGAPHGDADAGKEPYGRSGRLILETPSDAEASVEADSVVFPVMEPNMHDSQSDRSDLGIVGRTKSVDCPSSAIRTLDDRALFLFYGSRPHAGCNGKRGGDQHGLESTFCLD